MKEQKAALEKSLLNLRSALVDRSTFAKHPSIDTHRLRVYLEQVEGLSLRLKNAPTLLDLEKMGDEYQVLKKQVSRYR